jgi:hypothetical protein
MRLSSYLAGTRTLERGGESMATMTKCPYCYSDVDSRASICPQCKKRLKTSRNAIGCAVLLGIVIVGAIVLNTLGPSKPSGPEEGVGPTGQRYTKAPQHVLSDAGKIKPVIDLPRYIKANSNQLKGMLSKDYGASAAYVYDKVYASSIWRVKLAQGTLEIVPFQGKVVSISIHFIPLAKDRAVALALLGLEPTTPPTVDAVASPQWKKVFPGLDDVFGNYEPMGSPSLSNITVVPDKALADKWSKS